MISMTLPQSMRGEFFKDGRRVHLTKQECTILTVLLMRYPRTVPMADLIEAIYSEDPEGGALTAADVVMVHVYRLRAKLAPSALIVNEFKFGYRLVQCPDLTPNPIKPSSITEGWAIGYCGRSRP